MNMNETGLPKQDKLLIVVHEMVTAKMSTVTCEDIFVKAFKKYPNDFHLRGYPEYPDTGDATQRPLYKLRKYGLIQIRNKLVTLTEKGATAAEKLLKIKSQLPNTLTRKLSRNIVNEIKRIQKTDAFQLYMTNNKRQIVDTDFFSYLGTTVKTDRTDLLARIKTVEDVIDSIKGNDLYKDIPKLHNYLIKRFRETIKTKLTIGYPRRTL